MPAKASSFHPGIQAAIYARISKEEKDDQPGFSLTGQVNTCLRYAATYGITIRPEHIFQDDFTGKVPNRPDMDTLREVLAAGLVQALIVIRVDRLGRTTYDHVMFFKELERCHVALYLTSAAPGQESQEYKTLLMMLSIFSEFEHAIILERMEQGRRNRAMAGYPRKQRPPFGLRWVEELLPDGSQYEQAKHKRHTRGSYEIHPEEAALVLKIYHWHVVEGWPVLTITKELNAMGVPTIRDQRGYARPNHASGHWHPSSVHWILTNRDYLGTQIYGKMTYLERKANGKPSQRVLTPEDTWIPVTIPALIDPETFQKAQERLRLNQLQAQRNRKHTYLFGAGRITCGVCHLHMGGTTQDGRVYYKCNTQKGHAGACRRCLAERKLEAIVWREVQKYFSDTQVAFRLFQQPVPQAQQIPQTRSLREHTATLEKEQRQWAAKLQRLEDAYYDGTESRQEYHEKKTQFTKKKALVTTQLLALHVQEKQGQLLQESQAEMSQVLEVIADKVNTLKEAQKPEDEALLKTDLLTLLRLTVEYLPDQQVKIRIQPWPALGTNVAVVSSMDRRSGMPCPY